MPATRLLLTICLASLSVIGQAPALKDVHRVLPAFRFVGSVHAIGDVTGDNITDVVFVSSTYSVVWRGSADGVFGSIANAFPQIQDSCTAIVLADVDGDGDQDCVAHTANTWSPLPFGFVRVYLNDGSGRFFQSPYSSIVGPVSQNISLATADIDGDGDPDVVVGGQGSTTLGFPYAKVYVNNGAGQFSWESQRLPMNSDYTTSVTLADFNGDGSFDLYCANDPSLPGSGPDRLYRNDGMGFFTEVPLTTTILGSTTQTLRATDFDNDGDSDLLKIESSITGLLQVRFLENDGSGSFTAFVPALLPVGGPISQVLLGDWNADGRIDYALRYGTTVYPFVFVAPWQFEANQPPPAVTGTRDVVPLDYDGDGDTDLVAPSTYLYLPYGGVGGALDSLLLRNLGTSWGRLPPSNLPPMTWGSGSRQVLADVNGDGNLDAVWSTYSQGGGRIFHGDGSGGFVEVPAGSFGTSTGHTTQMALGDVDGDHDIDIVCANYPAPYSSPPPSKLFLNTNGTFASAPFPVLHGHRVAMGDLDGDGDRDLVHVGSLQSHILTNDGSGGFQILPAALPLVVSTFPGLHLADFDGDGDLDIAAWQNSSGTMGGLLLNNGHATFTTSSIPALALPLGASAVIAADFDHDGDVDLLAQAGQYPAGSPHQLLLNSGLGSFTVQSIPASPYSPVRRLIPVDVDSDGWTDLVQHYPCGTPCGDPASSILWNTGAGGFVDLPGSIIESPYGPDDPSFGDIDGDGDVDMLLAGGEGSFIYYNLHRQLAWRSLPRVGYPLHLDLFGRSNEPYVLAYALAPAQLPIPGFGTLHLDPGSLHVLIFSAYDNDGRAAFSAPTPNDPALVGLSIYWQALSGMPSRLGNLDVTTLQPH